MRRPLPQASCLSSLTTSAPCILAGDIGGTRTRLALHGLETGLGPPFMERAYLNQDFSSIEEVLAAFFMQGDAQPKACCLGVAGPVRDNRALLTNRGWEVDGGAISRTFDLPRVELVNDLVATAMGVEVLGPEDLFTLNPGEADPRGVVAVIAPGTGLGESFVVRRDGRSLALPTEGGHADFAPHGPFQSALLTFLAARYEHVSYERVCSGLALPELHAFCATRHDCPDWLRRRLDQGGDRTRTIIEAALAARAGGDACPSAVAGLETFVDILAAESANLALKTLATGGVFIGGGIPPRIRPFFESARFMAVFSRGVYAELLARIPVQVVLAVDTALRGAARLALSAMERSPSPAERKGLGKK